MKLKLRTALLIGLPAVALCFVVASCVTRVARTKAAEMACQNFASKSAQELSTFGLVQPPEELPGGGIIVIAQDTLGQIIGVAIMAPHIMKYNFRLPQDVQVISQGICYTDGLEFATIKFRKSLPEEGT